MHEMEDRLAPGLGAARLLHRPSLVEANAEIGGRVCRNVYPLASLLARGYAPVRYRALINEAVANVSFPDQQQQHKQRQQQHKKQTKSASGKRGTR